jgi:tyrosyl-tRNA synthetase
VHSAQDLENAEKASEILFGKSTTASLMELSRELFLEIFEGVPQASVSRETLKDGLDMIGALSAKTGFLKSNGEARRELKQQSIAVNKTKVSEGYVLSEADLIRDRFILLQRGKKNYFVLVVE